MEMLRSGNGMMAALLASTVVMVATVAFSLWHAVSHGVVVY